MNALLPYLAWTVSLVATTGSLYFSEVMRLPPCSLCWYQRILMYPLVWVLGVALFTADARLKLYSLPLALTGLAVAVYHNLLYYRILPESFTPCASGVSCTSRQLEWAGFITIPLLSLTAFALISLVLLAYRTQEVSRVATRPTAPQT